MDPLDIPTARLGQEFSHDPSSMTLIIYGKFEALTPPPPPNFTGNPMAFDSHPCSGGGKLELCLDEMGNLNHNCQPVQRNTDALSLKMEVF